MGEPEGALNPHHRQSSAAVVHIAVAEIQSYLSAFAPLAVEVIEVISCQLLQRASTRTMQDRHFACANHQRIVHVRNQLL